MLARHIITVFNALGQPRSLIGARVNTVRKYDGKYQGLQVGDLVVIHHTADPLTKDAVPLTEIAAVSSYALGTLDSVLGAHGAYNHDDAVPEEDLKEHILSFYPPPAGEEHDPNQLFIAIYF
jgi:hypothetical protein